MARRCGVRVRGRLLPSPPEKLPADEAHVHVLLLQRHAALLREVKVEDLRVNRIQVRTRYRRGGGRGAAASARRPPRRLLPRVPLLLQLRLALARDDRRIPCVRGRRGAAAAARLLGSLRRPFVDFAHCLLGQDCNERLEREGERGRRRESDRSW